MWSALQSLEWLMQDSQSSFALILLVLLLLAAFLAGPALRLYVADVMLTDETDVISNTLLVP